MAYTQEMELLATLARPFCTLDTKSLAQFEELLRLFIDYNTHTNLSAIREPEAIVVKHFVDSLALLSFESIEWLSVLDIGTGGGFPGIPLVLACSGVSATLLDSTAKKIRACMHFAEWLGITPRVTAIHTRAQDLVTGPDKLAHKGMYDMVVSRATAAMPDILTWAEPFVRSDWSIILYKTSSPEELQAGKATARKLGLKLSQTYKYTLLDQERYLFKFIRA